MTSFFGSFAYGAQNNWDYNLVNFVSLFNPRYWLWITLSLAIIYSMLSMTGEQVKQAKKAYKAGKQTAFNAGKSASAASRQGLKSGAKAFATTPMTGIKVSQRVGALGKGGGVKPSSKKQQMLREKRDVMMPTVAKVAATGHKGAQATMQKTYPQTALGAKGAATRARVKAITALAEKEKAAQKEQQRQKQIEAFSQRIRNRKGKEAMTRLAQQKAQTIKAKRPASPVPPIRPPPRPSSAPASSAPASSRGTVSVTNRVAAINGRPASATRSTVASRLKRKYAA